MTVGIVHPNSLVVIAIMNNVDLIMGHVKDMLDVCIYSNNCKHSKMALVQLIKHSFTLTMKFILCVYNAGTIEGLNGQLDEYSLRMCQNNVFVA